MNRFVTFAICCAMIFSSFAVAQAVELTPPSEPVPPDGGGSGGGLPSPTCTAESPITGPAHGNVTITVTSNDGLRLTDANVIIFDTALLNVASGRICGGSVTFGLKAGKYLVVADAPGYKVNTEKVWIKPKVSKKLTITLKRDTENPVYQLVDISGYGTVDGKVTLKDLSKDIVLQIQLEPPNYTSGYRMINGRNHFLNVTSQWGPVSLFGEIPVQQPIPTGPDSPPSGPAK